MCYHVVYAREAFVFRERSEIIDNLIKGLAVKGYTLCKGLLLLVQGLRPETALHLLQGLRHFALRQTSPTKHLPPDSTTAHWALLSPWSRTYFQILIVGLGASFWRWWKVCRCCWYCICRCARSCGWGRTRERCSSLGWWCRNP